METQIWEVVKLIIATIFGASGIKFFDAFWRNKRKDKDAHNKEVREEMEYIHQRHREMIDDGHKTVGLLQKKITKLEETIDEHKNKCTELVIENMNLKTKIASMLDDSDIT